MRILITGGSGMLGSELKSFLEQKGIDVYAPSSKIMDITDLVQVKAEISAYKPDVVIHCAAYTNVDKAEEERDKCMKINVDGTENVTIATALIGAKLIYISTDYVFNGTKEGEYTTEDSPNGLTAYGLSKWLGELAAKEYYKIFIIRISWVFGKYGNNFVKTMLKLSETKDEINVVNDQIGSPTYTKDLVEAIFAIAATEDYGTYHISNDGYCSWAEFAKYILKDTNTKINPVSTEQYYEPYRLAGKIFANRPLNSKLEKNKLYQLPYWKDAVDRFLEEIKGE